MTTTQSRPVRASGRSDDLPGRLPTTTPTQTEVTAVRTGAVSRAGSRRPRKAPAQKPKRSLIARIKLFVAVIMRRPIVVHLIAAAKRFGERLGSQFAGAITYFSFLALMPILLVAFSVMGFIFASDHQLLVDVQNKIAAQIPGGSTGLGDTIGKALSSAVDKRTSLGVVGLLSALYSAVGWMGNVRAAVQAQWRPDFDDDQEIAQDSFLKNLWKNLYMFVGLGLAILISFALSSVGAALSSHLAGWLHLPKVFDTLFSVLAFVLAVAADVLIFMWVYSVLPPKNQKAQRGNLIRGALIAAVAFEVLKVALTLILKGLSSNASWAVFGPIIGLLFFFNIVATMLLFVAAWIATSRGEPGDPNGKKKHRDTDDVPEPAVVIPTTVSRPKALGFVGVGAILGIGLAGRRRR